MSHVRTAAAAAIVGCTIIGADVAVAQQVPDFHDDRRLPSSTLDAAQAKRKADDDARRAAEVEAKRRADDDARRAAEAEAKRRADDDARRAAEAEAKRRADDDARRAAEAEAKRRADEDARRAAEAEAKRRADDDARRAAEVEAKRRADEDARRAAEAEAKRRADEDARRAAEAEAKRRADDDARRAAEAEAKRRADDTARREFAARYADSQRLLARARQFLTDGDMASARLLLERAADAGNPDAARELADTFDPALLARRGIAGAEANTAERDAWMRKAAQLQAALERANLPAAETTPSPVAAARPPQPLPATRPLSPATPSAETNWPRVLGQLAVPADRDANATRYLARGRQQRAGGDFNAARLLFQRAAELDSAASAVELAMTFDPDVLRDAAYNTAGAAPDRALARAWYERAVALGVVGLASRLQALGTP